MHKNNNRSICM